MDRSVADVPGLRPLPNGRFTGSSPYRHQPVPPNRTRLVNFADLRQARFGGPTIRRVELMQGFRSSALAAAVLSIVALAAACGSSGSSSSGGAPANDKALNGAGSTLVAPLMAQWAPDYNTKAGVTITYGPVGSGGGIDAITSRTVDFGASDAPLSSDQATACKGCVQIPWALGAVAITYNVKGLQNKVHLTGPVIADMFTGKVSSWNDPEIA